MQVITDWANAIWENHISQWDVYGTIRDLNARIYAIYFNFLKGFMDWTTEHKFRPLGLAVGTIFLELAPTVRTIARRIFYFDDPKVYGFNQIDKSHAGKHPVILIHGRMGTWSDLAELASKLKEDGIPVFVMDLNHNVPTEEDRLRIKDFVIEIRNQYYEKFPHLEIPTVDIVGHSLGGDMALYSSFTSQCSYIEEHDEATLGDLKIIEGSEIQSNDTIRKVITIGMPSNSSELTWSKSANKVQHLFNIIGVFDAIMGHKECALKDEMFYRAHVKEMDCGHLGLLNDETYQQVSDWLSDHKPTTDEI